MNLHLAMRGLFQCSACAKFGTKNFTGSGMVGKFKKFRKIRSIAESSERFPKISRFQTSDNRIFKMATTKQTTRP